MRFFAFIALLATALSALPTFAALPPARMIFQRTVDHSGSGTYVIEQEVQLPNGPEPLSLKETWVINDDRTMRVTVSALREPKDSVRLQILYAEGQRWILKGGQKSSGAIPADLTERPFHLRTLESAGTYFTNLKILPPRALDKKPLARRSEDIKRESEDFVRLARIGGVVAWAFGTPTPPQGAAMPGLWIEQDQFVIRKIRFSSEAEVAADLFTSYTRGLQFPKLRTLSWGGNTVSLRVLSVSGKGPTLSLSSLDTPWRIQGLEPATQSVVEEFYTRFR